MGIRYIAYEINEEYVKLIEKRWEGEAEEADKDEDEDKDEGV